MLTNARSERVRAVSALARRPVRERTGRFLVEGPQAVRELLTRAAGSAVALYLTPEARERHTGIVTAAEQVGVVVWDCSPEVLDSLADTATPQGMVAVARRVEVSLEEALHDVGEGFAAVLAEVRDPGNAGTVIRAADAFGAAAVLVSAGSVDVHNPKVVRSTAGSLFHLPVVTGVPTPDLLSACRTAGLRLLAADGTGRTGLPEADLSTGHAWVFGNEARGLPAEVLDACDEVVSIPIVRAESLNLAMAATVCLHASFVTSDGTADGPAGGSKGGPPGACAADGAA